MGNAVDPKQDFGFATTYFFKAKAAYGDGPTSADFDDQSWRTVDLPHDWAVELPFDPASDIGHGAKTIGRGYPQTSVGWYRRTLEIPASDLGRRISVRFDGAFRDAQVFINGNFVGRFPSGYDGFTCDLSEVLNYGGQNVLVVRLDASLNEGWFYEGAGLYRHVWLTKTNPVHMADNRVFVTSDVTGISDDGLSANLAILTLRPTVENQSFDKATIDIHQAVIDPEGKEVASGSLEHVSLNPGDRSELSLNLTLINPQLWSLESPTLYRVVTTIKQNGTLIDQYQTSFGVRTLRFDKDQGFFLNGKHVLIKGTCCHQDHAGVGVALPDALQTFRIKRLKEMGSNALRTSHNPPTPQLLDACDRLGMLVLDENRQTGTSAEAMDGLRKLILRDRNHPCVFLWSLGNEEWPIEGTVIGERVVAAQREVAHRLDPSRLVTTAISGGWGNGSSRSVDVMGFNYFTHGDVDAYHAAHPDQPCIGTEDASTTTTRGAYVKDDVRVQLPAYGDTAPSWAATAQRWINFYDARPFVAGAFVWTGFDYRGETTPFSWPAISSQFGILDTCGFAKDAFYFYQSCWSDEPMVHLMPHWNWPGKEGQAVDVRVYSNCDQVELALNGQSLGRKEMVRHQQLKWPVNYAAGTLSASAFKDGKLVARDSVQTTGMPATIKLSADRDSITADGCDVSIVTVQVLDSAGHMAPTAGNLIRFELAGPGKIIGVGNGDPGCHEPDVYVDQVKNIVLSWRVKPVTESDKHPETANEFDDSGWKAADEWEPEDKRSTGACIFRATVELPDHLAPQVAMFLSPGSPGTEIFINGKLLADPSNARDALRAGKNSFVVLYKHRPKHFSGSLRLGTPAGQWKRSLFNGLAQVIVQSKDIGGTITLTASGDGLTSASLPINSKEISK